nr:hypothetical protein [Tanacetum cinerariifolium]
IIARTANLLALVAQQQPVYHPQNHPTHYSQNFSTKSQQAANRNRGEAIINSPPTIYDQEPSMVADDDEMSKDKEIDKLMALISLSFKKIYKPTNNNLRTLSNTSNVAGARDTVGTTMAQQWCRNLGFNATTARNMGMLQENEEAGIQLNAEQADWKDDTDDESDDQELEAHYMYMAKFQQVSSDAVDSRLSLTLIQNKNEQIDQNDEDANLAKERELLASLIKKLKCEIDESKKRNKSLETSNKVLIDKLKSEIEDFKNKNKSLAEANNKLSKENDLLYADFKKSKAELKQRYSIEYATEIELECAKVKEMKNKLFAHQDTISILKQQKDAQIKLYKSREDKEIGKVIDLENKVK